MASHARIQCLIKLILWTLTIDVINGFCVSSYPDYTIDHISRNIGSDASIRYLGTKSSAMDCQHNCQDLNYLCDKSSSDVFDNNIEPSFANANCTVTFSEGQASVSLTDDLISKEYIINAQITATSGFEIGIYFKSNEHLSDTYDYYFAIDLFKDPPNLLTGYDCGTDCWNTTAKSTPSPIDAGTMYTLTVHVHNNDFVTYFEGDVHFSTYAHTNDAIGSAWSNSHAGVFVWNGAGTIHSFKLSFPDDSDKPDEKVCAAYLYDTNTNNCYGYYGTDYAQLQSTLSSNSGYDSAILYATDTCALTPNDTTEPTPNSSTEPTVSLTKSPAAKPTSNPSSSTRFPTSTPRKDTTLDNDNAPLQFVFWSILCAIVVLVVAIACLVSKLCSREKRMDDMRKVQTEITNKHIARSMVLDNAEKADVNSNTLHTVRMLKQMTKGEDGVNMDEIVLNEDSLDNAEHDRNDSVSDGNTLHNIQMLQQMTRGLKMSIEIRDSDSEEESDALHNRLLQQISINTENVVRSVQSSDNESAADENALHNIMELQQMTKGMKMSIDISGVESSDNDSDSLYRAGVDEMETEKTSKGQTTKGKTIN